MRRKGFSFIELLVALALLAILVPVGISAKALTEEELAIMEAESLARWLRAKFLEADAASRYFEILTTAAASTEFTIYRLDNVNGNVTKTAETYSSGGRARFSGTGTNLLNYNPVLNSLTPFGATVSVRKGSGTGIVPRYVVISRFGRVRVSESPPQLSE